MSQENVEAVQRSLGHYMETGEPDWLLIDDDVRVYDHDIPDPGDYRGHEGFGRWLEDWGSAWAQYTIEPEEFLDADDQVVVVLRMRATGQGSGVELERQDAMVCTLRDLKISQVDYYNNKAQALEAAGLHE